MVTFDERMSCLKQVILTVGFLSWMLLGSQAKAGPQSLNCYSSNEQMKLLSITESVDGKNSNLNFPNGDSIPASLRISYNSIRSETHHLVSKKYVGQGVEVHISGHAMVHSLPAKYSGALIYSASRRPIVCVEVQD